MRIHLTFLHQVCWKMHVTVNHIKPLYGQEPGPEHSGLTSLAQFTEQLLAITAILHEWLDSSQEATCSTTFPLGRPVSKY